MTQDRFRAVATAAFSLSVSSVWAESSSIADSADPEIRETAITAQQPLARSAERAVTSARMHILNMHSPLQPHQISRLREFASGSREYLQLLAAQNTEAMALEEKSEAMKQLAGAAIDEQIRLNIEQETSYKNNEIFFTTLINNLEALKGFNCTRELSRGSVTLAG
jgi:hypothetical protein